MTLKYFFGGKKNLLRILYPAKKNKEKEMNIVFILLEIQT